MSFEPQNHNSTMIRNPYYINQNQENEYRIRHKKELDNQIMDNILKINLSIFFTCLVIIAICFIIDFEIVIYIPKENEFLDVKYKKIGFSMYNFSVENLNQEKNSWKTSCIKSRIQDSTCLGLDFDDIKKNLGIEFNTFNLYKKLGITV